jgi:hypothetical protein
MPEELVKSRVLAGHINRCRRVYVFVCWSAGEDGGDWYSISKESAREIVADAQERGIDVIIELQENGRDLYIGAETEIEDEETEEGEEEEGEEEEDPAGVDEPSGGPHDHDKQS